MNLAIIPARGGSKRIAKKNTRLFNDKPIISYSINTAKKANLFDEIMVSTDSEEIAEVAQKYGATFPFERSNKNSNDMAPIVDVMNEVIDWYEINDIKLEWACCIYATAPFINSKDLISAFELLKESNADSVLAVSPFTSPIQRAFRLEENKLSWMFKSSILKRSQDLGEAYHDAGQFFWFNIERFKKNRVIMTDNVIGYPIDPINVQDIDTITDWKMAEFKYNYLRSIK